MENNAQKKLHRYFDRLRMKTAKKQYEELAQQAQNESLDYKEYLLTVIEAEYEAKYIRRVQRRLKESRIPLEKNLSTFEMTRMPGKVRQQFKQLLNGDFIKYNENILVFGNPGSGKTHISCALGQELIRKDKRVYFSTCALLLQKLLIAKSELRLPKLLKKLGRFDVIIVDDIGYVQQKKEEMEVLFTLLAERYENGSVIITSNLPFSKWGNIFKDPMMTAAVVDRLVHHSVILELNVESYRINSAKKKKRKENI